MFVIVADIFLKKEKEYEFKKWFSNSNKILEKFDGFISRRLLESVDGTHRIIVEHKNKDTFVNMHQSPEHEKLHEQALTFMEKPAIRKSYNVVAN